MGDLISRQAVDDAIYDYSRSCDVNYSQIMEFIDKIPSVTPAEKVMEWIPVSERLPEDKQKVIFTNKKNEIGLGIYHKRIGFLSDGITAWMPLPEPYKSESEG